MKKNKGIKILLLFILFPVIFGCLPATKREVVGPKREIVTGPLFSLDIIDKKIAYLNRILETKELKNEDKEIALTLLSAYKTILTASEEPLKTAEYRKIIHLLFTNLTRLDERYFLTERFDDQSYPKVITLFSQKKKKVLDDYLAEDYQGVINECLEMEAAFGPDSLTPEIGLLFAVSLAKRGLLKEAVNIGERIIRELEGKPDLIHLRSHFIEWQLDLGNRKKALQIYEKLIDNRDEREALFKRARRKVTGEDKKIARSENDPLKSAQNAEAEPQEQDPMQKLLGEVNRLVEGHAFTKAKLLLIKQRIRSEEGAEIETIDQALKTVDLAEERYLIEQNASLSHEGETLKMAKKLIEEENFEQAIAKLEEIKDNQDIDMETQELKELTIEKLINNERNKAAKFFLLAKKSANPVKKKELLLSSYNILKVLIDKYPSSNLINKLKKNLQKVNDELAKLDKDPG